MQPPWDGGVGEDYIDPDFKWANFTIEEQAKVITAARSNNELSPHKMWKDLFFLREPSRGFAGLESCDQ